MMETKLSLLERLYHEEAVKYIASRYGVTPEQIVIQYLLHDKVLNKEEMPDNIQILGLAPNEIALLRDMVGLTIIGN